MKPLAFQPGPFPAAALHLQREAQHINDGCFPGVVHSYESRALPAGALPSRSANMITPGATIQGVWMRISNARISAFEVI
jgi:hypothetical protein